MSSLTTSISLTLGLAALGSATALYRNPRAAGANVITSCSVPDTAALTFDDGPYKYLEDISNTLKNAGANGTFFFNGNNYDCIYTPDVAERVKFAYGQGHQVATHTWSHPDLTQLSKDQVYDQINRAQVAVQKITGALPAYFRPPYGSYNNAVLNAADSLGLEVVTWDFDSKDSDGESESGSEDLYDGIVGKRPDNILALNHETYESTAHDLLPYAIGKLQGAGYKLVTVADCLGSSPYQTVGAPASPDTYGTCSK